MNTTCGQDKARSIIKFVRMLACICADVCNTAQTVQANYSSAVSLTQITTATDDKHADPTSSLQVVINSLTGAQYTQNNALNCHDTVICFGSMPAMLHCNESMQI